MLLCADRGTLFVRPISLRIKGKSPSAGPALAAEARSGYFSPMGMPAPRFGSFSRSSVPRVLNMVLWLVFCGMAGTGLVLAFRLPPGSRGGAGLAVMGWTRHQWGDLHTWLSYAFLGLILAHLALHWRWLWQVAAKKHAWPLLAGIGAGLLLMTWSLFQPVEKRAGHGEGRGAGRAVNGQRADR